MVHMDSLQEETITSEGDFSTTTTTTTTDSDNIILYPFAHQVGGHTQLLTLDKSTLCKPLIPRELLFYLNVPKELVKFVPSYKGVVQIRETGQGNYPPVVYQPLRSPKSPYASKQQHGPGSSCTLPAKLGARPTKGQMDDLYGSSLELRVQIRPCSDEKILKKNLSQDNLLRADYISRPNEKYLLLLENVASKYQLPCILDLKMGTRQHGDDATEEKRHRQIAKCQASTSASLGVRLCGMQVYQVDYGGFLWYDKYYGRKMDQEGLKRALHEYFRNGSHVNEDIIDDVIDRLKLLSKAVEKSPSFRFYGTSLLIIHEGCTSCSNNNSSTQKRCPVDVRLIDFAHTICDYNNYHTAPGGGGNGRSSSSPSVLKSSSGDQITLPQLPATADSEHRPKFEEDADMENYCPPVKQQQQQQLRSSEQLETAAGEESNIITTNPGMDAVTTSENNNNNNNNINNNNINNNSTGCPVASPLRATNNHLGETTEKPANEVDPLSSSASSPATSAMNNNNNNNSITSSNNNNNNTIKQINSTPTTPPSSLGSRKISKTSMGPDKGLLFGLENLMRLLDDLKSETLITC